MHKLMPYNKLLAALFFLLLLALGIAIHGAYGVHWDEYQNQDFGLRWHRYVADALTKGEFSHRPAPFDYYERHDLIHGPFFEIVQVVVQKNILKLTDSRDILLLRHLMTFLLFYIGVVFFYLLCKLYFKSWAVALLGSVLLVISPRIFAHSFYNSVDISFLSLYIISMYTLYCYLAKKTLLRALFHAAACGLLIATRQIGIIIPVYTLILIVIEAVHRRKHKRDLKTAVKSILVYVPLVIAFTICFWPLLWENPLLHVKNSFVQMEKYTWSWPVLYMGEYIKATELPWHYTLVWIAISTPIMYVILFLIGCVASIGLVFKKSDVSYEAKRNILLVLLWFFLPIVLGVFYKGGTYDAWRHVFFVYPAFLIVALIGATTLVSYCGKKCTGAKLKVVVTLAGLLLIAGVLSPLCFMIRYHPYQNVYFNRLAGADMKQIKSRFELDYWGLSYREALEYIVSHDTGKTINVFVPNLPGKDNANILEQEERKRLIYMHSPYGAKYFIAHYRWHPEDYSDKKKFFSVEIGNTDILAVYRLEKGEIIDSPPL